MTQSKTNSKRIFGNTVLLYLRMALTMAISLYTSRIVLQVLGVEDYGLYNVVGGLVAMFGILSGSLSSTVSRFMTYELGAGNIQKLKTIFSTSVTIYFSISVLIFIVAEIVGLWFVKYKMTVPDERIFACQVLLQFSILTFITNLITIPYNAAIIAHEKMKAFAYVTVAEVSLKLLVVYLLQLIACDSLILYGAFIFLIALMIRLIYRTYCRNHFEECTYKFIFAKDVLKSMSSFAGWNMIGAVAGILRGQGTNLLLNVFCGPIVNAARGISFQVNNTLMNFVQSFLTAVKPQIIKSYASNDRDYLYRLTFLSSRGGFYLLCVMAVPLILRSEYVLELWLKEVPEYTVYFVQLILIDALIASLSEPLISLQLATGKIRMYQILVGGLYMLNFPLCWLFLHLGFSPISTNVVFIFITTLCLFARVLMLKRMINFPGEAFFQKVICNIGIVFLLSMIGCNYLNSLFASSFIGLIAFVCVTLLYNSIIIFLFLGKEEKKFVFSTAYKIAKNLKK